MTKYSGLANRKMPPLVCVCVVEVIGNGWYHIFLKTPTILTQRRCDHGHFCIFGCSLWRYLLQGLDSGWRYESGDTRGSRRLLDTQKEGWVFSGMDGRVPRSGERSGLATI